MSDEVENEVVEAPEPVSTEPTPPGDTPSAAGLGVSDLLLMLQTIQVIARRGGFRADEMANVGGLHDRLLNFLETSGAITREAPKTEGTQSEGSISDAPAEGDNIASELSGDDEEPTGE